MLYIQTIPAYVPGKYKVLEHITDLAQIYFYLEIFNPISNNAWYMFRNM